MPALAAVSPAADNTDDASVPRSRIVVAKLGSYHDHRYGDFAITAAMAAKWQANLTGQFGGRIAIDLDHAPERGRGTEAAGWITGLSVEAPYVYGNVEWTPLGESAIKERRYLYVSPTFSPDYQDEHGKGHGDALVGLALTNRPVLRRDMPTLNLSREEFTFAEEIASPPPEPTARPDSPPSMDTIKLTKALGLPEDADEAKILAAVTEAKSDTRTLLERAEAEDKVLLSKAEHDNLKAADEQVKTLSDSVAALHKERADEKFDAAFKTALADGRVDAKEETKSLHRALYDAKPDDALRLLASLPKQVNLSATGSGGGPAGSATPASIDGHPVDEGRARILERAEAIATERSISLAAAAQIATDELEGATV